MKISNNVALDGDELRLFGGVGEKDGIDAETVGSAAASVSGDITIYLNSLGGDVWEAMAIVAALKRRPGRKTIVIDGVAASAASVIAMAGDRIIMSPGAMMMIHQPYATTMGTADQLRGQADALDEAMSSIVALYAERTGNPASQIREWMVAETWMNARTALERGFCDAIEGEEEEMPDASGLVNESVHRMVMDARFSNAPEGIEGILTRALEASGAKPAAAKEDGRENHSMKQIMNCLGLAEDSTEDIAVNAIATIKADAARISAIQALADEAEARAKAFECRATEAEAKAAELADKASDLEGRISVMEKERLEGRISHIMDAMRREGRLIPAQEDWARKLGRADIASLEAFAASAPVVINMASQGAPAIPARKTFAEMTADEKAELYATDKELYEQMKKNG